MHFELQAKEPVKPRRASEPRKTTEKCGQARPVDSVGVIAMSRKREILAVAKGFLD